MTFHSYSIIFVLLFTVSASKVVKNERNITGKVMVVTGGAQGIGFAIADNFLKNGAKVAILLDINEVKGKQAENTLNSKYGKNKADYMKCDVTKDLDRVYKQIITKYRYVHILVNNAAVADENKPQEIIETNLMGTILFSLKFYERMRNDKAGGRGGTIMNVASVAAHNIDPIYNTYRSTKFGILAFSQSRGHLYNYYETGVRIITLCPGPTNTTLVYKVYELYDKDLVERIIKYYNFATIQSSDNVGKGAVKVFKDAESGTSWDIADEKEPKESANVINIVPYKDIDGDDRTSSKKEEKNDRRTAKKNKEKPPNNDKDNGLVSVKVKL